MRRRIVLAGLTAFLILMSVIVGCGTLVIDFDTTVKASGDIIQEIRFEGTGMMATMMEEDDFAAGFGFGGEEGWVFDIERTDDSVVMTATGYYALDKNGNVSPVEDGPDWPEEFSLRFEEGLLSKNYFIEVDVSGSEEELEEEVGELDETVSAMLEDMFDISWTITLPGKIVESNADFIEGSSATWDFNYNTLISGRFLTVHSQSTNWPVIGGIIAGVVVVLALVAFLFIRRKRALVSSPSEIVDEGATFSSQ